jgi:hypothetical protein
MRAAGTLRRCSERSRRGCASSCNGVGKDLEHQTVNDRMATTFREHRLKLPARVPQAFYYLIFSPAIDSTIWSDALEKGT